MGASDKPTTRRYSREQKDQAVRLVRQLRAETGHAFGAVKRVAEQLGYGVESVRSWVKQADIDDGVTAGTTTLDAERTQRLEQENREVAASQRDSAEGVRVFRPGGTRPPTSVIVGFID